MNARKPMQEVVTFTNRGYYVSDKDRVPYANVPWYGTHPTKSSPVRFYSRETRLNIALEKLNNKGKGISPV